MVLKVIKYLHLDDVKEISYSGDNQYLLTAKLNGDTIPRAFYVDARQLAPLLFPKEVRL